MVGLLELDTLQVWRRSPFHSESVIFAWLVNLNFNGTRSSPAGLRAPPGDGQSLCVQNLASHLSILCRFRHIFIEIA